MSEENIFDGNAPADPLAADTTKQDALAPLLTKVMEIKNEAGEPKYDSLEKAIDALAASQDYIPKVKGEAEAAAAKVAALQAQLEATGSVEDIVNKLLESKLEPKEPVQHQEQAKGLNEDDVAKLVRQENERLAAKAKADANAQLVTTKLTEKYGEKAKEEIAKKASELGYTPQRLGELATENPKMVLGLFDLTGDKPLTPTPIQGDTSTSGFQQSQKTPLEKPAKSLLSGATSSEQKAYMQKIKEEVYEKLGVET